MQKYYLWPILGLLFSCAEKKAEETTAITHCTLPQVHDEAWYSSGKTAPLLNGLEGLSFPVSTTNDTAALYFQQGLMLCYGFNHAEAARSFFEATRRDSTFAMAYWGLAYTMGANINAAMSEDLLPKAREAIQKAQVHAQNASEVEKGMINALATRYAEAKPAEEEYAQAMKKVYLAHPTLPDVAALYAESLMNLHPWDLYRNKVEQPWTGEILTLLEYLIKKNPLHPGAHHFYIHAVEASPTPEKALASAKLLESLVPGSGHLVHMPSHIYINTGDYHQGTLTNLKAIQIDSLYTTTCHAQGAYPLSYFPHNYHFLTATATLEGNSTLAWSAAKKLQSKISTAIMREEGWGTLQHYYSIPYYVGVKFALWEDILALPKPDLPYPKAIWHYARGMALAGKMDLPKAKAELDSLEILSKNTDIEALTIWDINGCSSLTAIATLVLKAELEKAQDRPAKAIAYLKEAVALEDKLNYNEPPDWFFSVRHHLGAAQLQAKQYAAAEKTFNEDLKIWKKNGWALSGLKKALSAQGKNSEATATNRKLEEAWQHADIDNVPLFQTINLGI
jgi:tetratricopeptide (TPR) repeat protein